MIILCIQDKEYINYYKDLVSEQRQASLHNKRDKPPDNEYKKEMDISMNYAHSVIKTLTNKEASSWDNNRTTKKES